VFGIRCRVQANVDIVGLDDGIATGLYRIAQEAVTNALRHAAPSTIGIQLAVRHASASLRIEDDGRGIADLAKRAAGLGLQIMTLRARRMGARLEVRPRPAGGTAVICLLTDRRQNARGADVPDPL
jgi:signal transduction histidine kinase